jgi:hypothetical protein
VPSQVLCAHGRFLDVAFAPRVPPWPAATRTDRTGGSMQDVVAVAVVLALAALAFAWLGFMERA